MGIDAAARCMEKSCAYSGVLKIKKCAIHFPNRRKKKRSKTHVRIVGPSGGCVAKQEKEKKRRGFRTGWRNVQVGDLFF